MEYFYRAWSQPGRERERERERERVQQMRVKLMRIFIIERELGG